MKLTTQQIATIDETLVLNGLIYDDFKLEVADHIASEIEAEMRDDNISFEVAFRIAFENWKEQLRPNSSVLIGLNYFAPRIVIKKWESIYISQFKFSLLSALVFSILMTTITMINTQEYIYNALKLIFASVYFLLCLTVISGLIYELKFKSKTIYGRFFKGNCGLLPFHFYMIYTFFNGDSRLYRYYNRESFIENILEWLLAGFFFFMAVYSVMVAIKHFKTMRKYKIS